MVGDVGLNPIPHGTVQAIRSSPMANPVKSSTVSGRVRSVSIMFHRLGSSSATPPAPTMET